MTKNSYAILFFLCVHAACAQNNIADLSQHFNKPGADISPWMFVPQENIKEISTRDHPGLAAIWQNGKGIDIKGILREPIKIDKYALPWCFQLGLVQNYLAMVGMGSKQQHNYAIGLNVAVTFSDPSVWPKDRTKRPPDTHDFQLLVVHLGSTGDYEPGLPQYAPYPHPETYLVWGRGDLGNSVMGDWQVNYTWDGSTTKRHGGPASHEVFFRCKVLSPETLEVSFNDDPLHQWNTRTINCSKYGKITGIWEIGPIFSCDRWIPDVLCHSIPIIKGPHPLMLKGKQWSPVDIPEPLPPDPVYEFYVDHCVFFEAYPAANLEHLSDDFDIPGFIGSWQFQIPFSAETWSHPGYLTITLLGACQGMWLCNSAAPNLNFKLKQHQPPWEIETCFIAPDDNIPWNLYLNLPLLDANNTMYTWRPCIINDPDKKRHYFANASFDKSAFDIHYKKDELIVPFHLKFKKEIPEEILSHKPLYWLFQMIDTSHVRMAFKARPQDKWYFSEILDCSEIMGSEIKFIHSFCWSTVTGRHFNRPPGSPMYQQFLFDYIHYRYGLSQ